MNVLDRVASVDEAAAEWGLTPQRIMLLCKSGQIVSRKAAGVWLIDMTQPNPKGTAAHRKRGPKPLIESESNEVNVSLFLTVYRNLDCHKNKIIVSARTQKEFIAFIGRELALETPDEWLNDLSIYELEEAIKSRLRTLKSDGSTMYSAVVGDLEYEVMVSRSWKDVNLNLPGL